MQIIENWTDITGEIESCQQSGIQEGFLELAVKIKNVRDVKGFSNLLKDAAGQTITVQVPEEAADKDACKPGKQIACRVRRGGPNRIYAHPEHVNALPK